MQNRQLTHSPLVFLAQFSILYRCGTKLGNMKAILYLVATTVLVSFTRHDNNEIDGIWMGYYRTEDVRERVVVKFSAEDRMEFYTGGVDENTRCLGSYKISGDSVSFTYTNASGQEIIMKGHFNNRKTYVDGVWLNTDEASGKFYLEKQKVEERIVRP